MKSRAKSLVLCEGKEDRLVMQALAEHAGLGEMIDFEDYGGEAKLRDFLRTLIVRPDYVRGVFSNLLVTRDADQSHQSAWDSLRDSIQTILSVDLPEPGAWHANDQKIEISAWVIPGSRQPGMIESLCLVAARSDFTRELECLEKFSDCLQECGSAAPHEKVRFAIWTMIAQGSAARDRLSLERAIQHLTLNWDHEAFRPLTEVLRGMAKRAQDLPA